MVKPVAVSPCHDDHDDPQTSDAGFHDDHDDPQTSDPVAVVEPVAVSPFHDGHDDPQTSDLGAVIDLNFVSKALIMVVSSSIYTGRSSTPTCASASSPVLVVVVAAQPRAAGHPEAAPALP